MTAAVAVYLAATGIGLLLRLLLAGWAVPIPFDHLLHAHSHALYFGWAAAPILISALPPGRASAWGRWALTSVVPMTIAFLAQGYGPVSIAASALVMAVWYVGIAMWWRGTGGREFTASLAYVLVSSLGVWVLAALQAAGSGEGLAGRLAVHAFLSTFAWSLVLGTVALLMRAEMVHPSVARRATRWWTALAWLFFPLGVVSGPEVPILGWAARIAGVLALVPAVWWATALWKTRESVLRAAAGWIVAATAGLAGAGFAGSSLLTLVGRPGVVFYLHALLLGYVTTVLAWCLARGRAVDIDRPLWWHHVGVATMLAGVLAPLVGVGRPGLWLAAVGALGVWLAGWWWAARIFAPREEMVSA
ncbi:MAG TPA: hypothetical protein VK011_00740 [Acidimicrobiia bacterium]|nr:hypothetical protein [Acidimicrobiia bacterium]